MTKDTINGIPTVLKNSDYQYSTKNEFLTKR